MASDLNESIVPYSQFEQLQHARDVIRQEAQTLMDVSRRLDAHFCAAIEALRQCEGRVIITGMGKAGLIGQKIAATMASTGTAAHFLHPAEAVHGDLGMLQTKDCVLILSQSGETEEICRLLPILKRMAIPTIAITASDRSTLGQQADITIQLGRLTEAGLHGLPPTSSTTATLAIGDALALVLAKTIGFTAEQFGRFHPAGSLGKKLCPVQDVMRTGEELRLAQESESIRTIFGRLKTSERRTGAIIITEETGQLSGLFTDSDLARLLENHRENQFDRPVREVMTANPLTIRPTSLLSEAVDILVSSKVSELPVVNEQGEPIGLIDITDVLSLMPTDSES